MNQGPIFVGGPNRSGTSLMYAILASHPNISMSQRTDLWRYFHGQFGDLSQQENFEACLDAMVRYRRISRLEPDPERIRREFLEGEPTYGRLFALIHGHRAEQVGRPRWGDKSLHSELHADQVFAEFPNARFIHIVRDPRDRYASEKRKFSSNEASATARWSVSAWMARRNRRRYPQRYMVVRYETLASQPEETVRRVCEFIGEPYVPAMLEMRGAPEHLAQGGDSSFEPIEPGEISTRSIGRFPNAISGTEIAFIQMIVGWQMAHFDYEQYPVELSPRERLSLYFVTLPWGVARMGRSLARKWYKHIKGRTIKEHRILDDKEYVRAVEGV